MNKKLLFIINPHSGRGEIKTRAIPIIDKFTKNNYLVTIYTTQNAGDAERIIAEIGEHYNLIVSCGGDGMVNESINGLMKLKKRPPFAIIPAGTTNDYAYTLHIPFHMLKAADVAMSKQTFNVDVGRFNGRYFSYVAAFGLFTDVTYETPQDAKNMLGSVAYVLEGAKRISSLQSYHIKLEYDEGILYDDVILAFFSNTISVAGIRSAFKEAKLDDGLLEITLIKVPKTLLDAQAIMNLLLNYEKMSEVKSDFLKVLTTKSVKITCEQPISWTIDGENGGSHTEVIIENVPNAIDVVIKEI